MTDAPHPRRTRALELTLCAVLVTIVSVNALRRMDYFGQDTAHHIRMTDASRSAFVGKRIADGDGYKTNDLPSALIDFYDQRGKLHDADWVNADRFPFTAYATAALYLVFGSTSETVGILIYNLVCFVAFLVLLYRLARSLFGESWTPLIAVTLALTHPYTYIYLYLKDADMLLLTVGLMTLLVAYFHAAPEAVSRWVAIGLGTLLAWLFLARPNLGAPFVLGFLIVAVRRWRRHAKAVGERPALRRYVSREGLAFVVAGLWLVPFVIHSLAEWGSPLFSANNLYQLPLGTRYDMGTDTWWKYTEPGHPVTLGTLVETDRAMLIGKFTTSWVATIRSIVSGFAFELVFAFGGWWWIRRTSSRGDEQAERGRLVGMLAGFVGFTALLNFCVLPLYGYQHYAYRHYLGFIFPLMWMLGAAAIYTLACNIKPAAAEVRARFRANPALWIGIGLVVLIAWNLGGSLAGDANRLAPRTASLLSRHWLAVTVILVALAAHRWLRRPRWLPVVAIAFALVYTRYRPDRGIKTANLIWFPANDAVWSELAKRHGIVSSLALQSEVAWNTGRKNIPVPEWAMHLYSFKFDHDLEIEDLYIESADALLSKRSGPFSSMAPGFEGYLRLQQYRGHLPGYAVAFHDQRMMGYPEFGIRPLFKASTVYKLVDRAAVAAMARSPETIALGDPANVLFTAHGWAGYYTVEDARVVVATDTTRRRYPRDAQAPWEDTSVTLFLDDRRPTSAVFEFYAPRAATYTFFWNLDLYAYDLPADRGHHEIARVEATAPGWQRAVLPLPPALLRKGLNKLGFRASSFQPIVFCGTRFSDEACLRESALVAQPDDAAPIIMRPPDQTDVTYEHVSLLARSLALVYPAR